MNIEEQNSKNKGSLALLLALILLVGVAIVVYGIIVSAEQGNTTHKTADTILVETLPERVESMSRLKALKEQIDKQAEELEAMKELRESVSSYQEFLEEIVTDMVELNQTVATRF